MKLKVNGNNEIDIATGLASLILILVMADCMGCISIKQLSSDVRGSEQGACK